MEKVEHLLGKKQNGDRREKGGGTLGILECKTTSSTSALVPGAHDTVESNKTTFIKEPSSDSQQRIDKTFISTPDAIL